MTENTNLENYSKVISKAWTDKEFKAKLMSDPKSALKELGIEVPADINLKIVEDDANSVTLVLPTPPKEGDLSVEDLNSISGGTFMYCVVCVL